MSSLIDSPTFSTIVGMAGASVVGIGASLYRLMNKVAEVSEKASEIAEDVAEIKNDRNIVRWSDIARIKRGRKWHVF